MMSRDRTLKAVHSETIPGKWRELCDQKMVMPWTFWKLSRVWNCDVMVTLLGCWYCRASSASVPPSLLIIESSRSARCFPRISETYKSPLQQVEGARRKVLLPVFYEWLPEGSRDNSSQPCPSRSLTSSTSLQQKGMAYQLTQWGVISSHSLVAGPNISRKWDETHGRRINSKFPPFVHETGKL